MSIDNNQNLISIGNEIITNSSSIKQNNISKTNNHSIIKDETLTKSKNNKKIKTIKNYDDSNTINDNYTQRNLFLHSTMNPNDTKITTYSNLSKLI